MSEDSAPVKLGEAKRRLQFEPTLNLNNVISLLAIAASAAGLWSAMQAQQAALTVKFDTLKEQVAELKAEVKELRLAIQKR